jgi:hypothetical protein
MYVCIYIIYTCIYTYTEGRISVVGVATRYRMDGPGIESRRGEFIRTRLDRPRGSLSILYIGVPGLFPGDKEVGAWR